MTSAQRARRLRPGAWASSAPNRLVPRLVDAVPPLVAFFVYLRTLAPGVYGLDSAELATGAYTLGIVHPTGYPLYLILARLFMLLPLGSVAYRANLFSAVLAGLTVWVVQRLALRLTGHRGAALVGSLSLSFAHSFWSMATVAEVYTLQTLLLAVGLLLAERGLSRRRPIDLQALALVYGLVLSNHVSAALYAPLVVWCLARGMPAQGRLRLGVIAGGLFLFGLSPYLYLPLRQMAGPPLNYVAAYYDVDLTTLSGILWMASGQAYRFFAFGYDPAGYAREWIEFAGLVWSNFTGLGAALGLIGVVSQLARRVRLLPGLAGIFFATAAFFAGYAVADKETMFLPAFLAWSLWLAEGARAILSIPRWFERQGWPHARLLRASIPTVLALMPILTLALTWKAVDKSDAFATEMIARQILQSVEPEAVIVGQWSSAVVLEYLQLVEGMRPDVLIINRSRYEVAQYYELWRAQVAHRQAMERILLREKQWIGSLAAERPVYGVEYDPALADDFEYRPVGTVFEMVAREQAE